MTDDKITEVLDLYEERLARSNSYNPHIVHMRTMIPKMREFVVADRREKLMRWLGFMQGAFWVMGMYSLEDLKRHSMPTDAEFDMSS